MWETSYVKSWLVLKEHGSKKAVVIRVDPSYQYNEDMSLPPGQARLYEGWLNGRKIYDPTLHFKVGQVVELPA